MVEHQTYSPPVDQLLLINKMPDAEIHEPRDYIQQYGFTADHVPELARLMTDTRLWELDDNEASSWAVIHALRALTQIQTDEAIQALLDFALLEKEGTWVEEWLWDELPEAFGQIGAKALPALAQRLQKASPAQLTLLGCVEHIARNDPDARTDCVNIITGLLAHAATNEPDFNGFLIAALMDMDVAKDHLGLIEATFATDNVDLSIAGDWDDVQVELGLKEADPNKVRPSLLDRFFGESLLPDSPDEPPLLVGQRGKADKKAKKKRKEAKKARKKNRKK